MTRVRRNWIVASLLAASAAFTTSEAASPRFESDTGSARIPIVVDDGHVFLRGRIGNSGPLWLSLDTGASGSVLDVAVAARLGMRPTRSFDIHGPAGAADASRVRPQTVRLPGVSFEGERFTAIDLSPIANAAGRPLDAILGSGFFHRFVVEIDYAGESLVLHSPRRFRYAGSGSVVPFTLREEQPYVRAEVTLPRGRRVHGDFVIDMGSGRTLMLAADFARTHDVQDSMPRSVTTRGVGVGGDFPVSVGRLDGMRIGAFDLPAPVTLLPAAQITAGGSAGNIGGGALRRFRVWFDYPQRRMILEPARDFARPDEFDMSGMTLEGPLTDGVRITRVLAESPAAAAGIEPGDELLAVDGTNVGELGVGRLRESFRRDGTVHVLSVRRDGATRRVTLRLQRLI